MSDISNSIITKEERCCKNCYFYEEGLCKDFDGFYFNWRMRETSHCPDFQTDKEVETYGIRFD